MGCILCGEEESSLVCRKGEYSVVRCGGCEFVYATPLPAKGEVHHLYAPEEEREYVPKVRRLRRLRNRLLLRVIEGFSRGGKMLEIGCHQGDLLLAAERSGRWEAMGIDLSEGPLRYAESLGLKVARGTIEEQGYEDNTFDVVAGVHLIEHLHDPIGTVSEVRRVLKPGGILFVVTPCVTHIKARLAGAKWKYYFPPEHLWYFSPKTFRLFAAKTGLVPRFASCLYNQAHLRGLAAKPRDS